MGGTHRFFDHTGDIGVELEASSRAELFEEAARSVMAVLTDAPGSIEAREERRLEVAGVDDEDLLVALANEVLFVFETEGWLAAGVTIEGLEPGRLAAVARGEPFDAERHPIARPIKAVTHHRAEITERDGRWSGRLVFDL